MFRGVITIITIFIYSLLNAQSHHYNISTTQGLSTNECYDIEFTSSGELIIAQNNGVYFYNGRRFLKCLDTLNKASEVYLLFPFQNEIYGISREHIVRINQKEKRIETSIFNEEYQKIRNYFDGYVLSDAVENNGMLSFLNLTYNNRILRYDLEKDVVFIDDYRLNAPFLTFQLDSISNKIVFLKGKNSLASNTKYFKGMNPRLDGGSRIRTKNFRDGYCIVKGKAVSLIYNGQHFHYNFEGVNAFSLLTDDKHVYVGTNAGIYFFDDHLRLKAIKLKEQSVGAIKQARNGEIWCSTLTNGVYRLNEFIESEASINKGYKISILRNNLAVSTIDQKIIYLNNSLEKIGGDKTDVLFKLNRINYHLDRFDFRIYSNHVTESYRFQLGTLDLNITGSTTMLNAQTVDYEKYFMSRDGLPITLNEMKFREGKLGVLMPPKIVFLDSKSENVEERKTQFNYNCFDFSSNDTVFGLGNKLILIRKDSIDEILMPHNEKLVDLSIDYDNNGIWLLTKKSLSFLDFQDLRIYSSHDVITQDFKAFDLNDEYIFLLTSDHALKINKSKFLFRVKKNNRTIRLKIKSLLKGGNAQITFQVIDLNFGSHDREISVLFGGEYHYTKDLEYIVSNLQSGDNHIAATLTSEKGESLAVDHINVFYPTPFFNSWLWYSILILIILIVVLITIFGTSRFIKNAKNKQIERMRLETAALQSQMNPHFTFNSLNSVLYFMIGNDTDKAVDYLSRFSRLLRLTLDRSNISEIPLNDDIEHLKLYLNIEATRFEENFDFNIHIDEHLLESNYLVPPMLVQPIVENSIWHGLLKKKGEKHLELHYSIKDDVLEIVIEDNGVGITINEERNDKISHGLKNTKRRIEIFNDRKINRGFQMQENLGAESGVQVVIRLVLKRQNK